MSLVLVLRLNDPEMVASRLKYMELLTLWRRHPEDEELAAWARREFSYPDDLPDLAGRLRQHHLGNTRPDGVTQSFFRMRERASLPDVYGLDQT